MVPVNSPGATSASTLRVAQESPPGHTSSAPLAKSVYSPAVIDPSPVVRAQRAWVLSTGKPSGPLGGWVMNRNPRNFLPA